MTLDVMPFELPEPMLDQGLYCPFGPAKTDERARRSGGSRTRSQVLPELNSLRAYGVDGSLVADSRQTFGEKLKLMKKADLPTVRASGRRQGRRKPTGDAR